MSNEELERAIDFLLKSQANLEAQSARTDARVSRLADEVSRVVGQVSRVEGQVTQLTSQLGSFADTQANIMLVMTRTFESQGRINESLRSAIVELAAKQGRTEDSLASLTQKVETLTDAQAGTDRRLDALIKIVEDGHNGHV